MEKRKLKNLFRKQANKKLSQRTDDHCMHLQSEEEKIEAKVAKVVECRFKNQFNFKSRDRVLKEISYQNPYALPDHVRVATKPTPHRKEKPIIFTMEEPRTTCDIDPGFFEMVEGRPIRNFIDIKVYMKHIRDATLFRADAAYLKDQILQIDKFMYDEKEDLHEVLLSFSRVKSNFMRFAGESYAEAKHVQSLAEKTARQLAIVIDELEGLNFQYVTLRNKVADIFVVYENIMRYQHFLFRVSPIVWKERHSSLNILSSTLRSNLFQELVTEASPTLYKKAALALTQIPARMYFMSPHELVKIFDAMSRQCLNYIHINTIFSGHLEKLFNQKKIFLQQVKDECTLIKEVIENLEMKVKHTEETKNDYEAAFYAILENKFYQLYASFEPIKLFTCVQFVHHQIFQVAEDPRDNLTTLMADIEVFYKTINKRLETLDVEVVNETAAKMFSEDIKRMKLAALAQRQLKSYDATCRDFYRSFEPPKNRSCLTKEPGK